MDEFAMGGSTENSAYGVTNSVYYKTNSAYTTVNAAYTCANSKINTVNGIATGIFNVQGTHRVDGNVKIYGATNTFEIIDGAIYINGVLWNPISPGTVIYTASQSAPAGYLIANGQAVSRSTYAALFAAISTTYGPGNGSTTFNVPDLRGSFIRGWDNGKGLDSGRAFGSYQADGVGPLTIEDPGHHHTIPGSYEHSFEIEHEEGYQSFSSEESVSTSTEETGITITNTISETRPKNIALLPCIKY